MAPDPIHQFQITKYFTLGHIGGQEIAFTNSSAYMFLSVAVISLLMIGGSARGQLVPGRIQSIAELSYEFVAATIRSTAGSEGMKFFPLIFTLFMFVLFCNLFGLLPYSFTPTSHIIVTFAMAICVIVAVTAIGFYIHGLHFLSFFVPHGAPPLMYPLLVPIEILSYCVRPVSLSIRLFVNMMAGHTMLKVFAGFVIALGVFGVAPLAVTVALYGFEVAVAFLQAYIFTVLTCIYLNDAIHMH